MNTSFAQKLGAYWRCPASTDIFTVRSDDDPISPIRRRLELAAPVEMLDQICAAVIGLAKQRADTSIRQGKPALINVQDFRHEVQKFVARNNLPGYLRSITSPPDPTQVEAVAAIRPNFVRQLELIEIGGDQQIRAVSDYLRTKADRTDWADRGLIFDDSLRDWDDDLTSRYFLCSGETEDLYGDKPGSIRGRQTYRRCVTMNPSLDGQSVPGHFVHGSFNVLADDLRIGWHPDYKTILLAEEEE